MPSPSPSLEAFLARTPFFGAMPAESVRRVAALAREKHFRKGEFVFHEGDPCEGFYVVREGAVKVMRVSPDGRERVLFLAEPPQSFAEVAVFLGDGLNPASARAERASRVVFFPKEDFLALLRERREIHFHMLASLAQWTKHLVRLLASMTDERAEARLARYVLDAAGKRGAARISVTKQTLASYLSMSPETLSRALRALRDEKILRVKGRSMEILNRAALERKAAGVSGR